jgi:hypothetical protein
VWQIASCFSRRANLCLEKCALVLDALEMCKLEELWRKLCHKKGGAYLSPFSLSTTKDILYENYYCYDL